MIEVLVAVRCTDSDATCWFMAIAAGSGDAPLSGSGAPITVDDAESSLLPIEFDEILHTMTMQLLLCGAGYDQSLLTTLTL